MNETWRRSLSYKGWQTKVFKRDNFSCRQCGTQENIAAHHIKSPHLYPQLRFVVKNGLTLCSSCHTRVGDRTYRFRGKGINNGKPLFTAFEKALRSDALSLGILIVSDSLNREAKLYSTPTNSVVLFTPKQTPLNYIERALEIMLDDIRLRQGKTLEKETDRAIRGG